MENSMDYPPIWVWVDMIREIVLEPKRADGDHVVACFTKGVNEDRRK